MMEIEQDVAPLLSSPQQQQMSASVAPRFSHRLKALVVLGVLLLLANVAYLQYSLHLVSKYAGQEALEGADAASVVTSLWLATQNVSHETSRGIVLPLYDDIATLGVSLVLELRSLNLDLPIEIPHCGDLEQSMQDIVLAKIEGVRIYDVCEQAARAKTEQGAPLFCKSLDQCHKRFRSFDVKLIAVVFSRFQELMLMDADTLYFKSPMALWESSKYMTSGTLFFHDRISCETTFLAELDPGSSNITRYQRFMSSFKVTPYRMLDRIPRTHASWGSAAIARATPRPVVLQFEPSDFLLTSHSWNRRAGHQMDSSLVLWNKLRQPRATTILASFASLFGARPPSYGDKELFFIACELAETAYEFSDFGVGSIGGDFRNSTDVRDRSNSVLCGETLHYIPKVKRSDEGTPLYLNGDSILTWKPSNEALYRTKARPAWVYPGSVTKHNLNQECLFDIVGLALTDQETTRILERQKMHDMVLEWLKKAPK